MGVHSVTVCVTVVGLIHELEAVISPLIASQNADT